eukprot:SAG11_NODE_13178_length_666_cov_1.749559_1_plen_22_part_10
MAFAAVEVSAGFAARSEKSGIS